MDILVFWLFLEHPHDVLPEFVLDAVDVEASLDFVDGTLFQEGVELFDFLEGDDDRGKLD